MTIDDYDGVYNLWLNTPGIGLNDLDDSRQGIERYLERNPKTCFVAEKIIRLSVQFYAEMMDGGDLFIMPRYPRKNAITGLGLLWLKRLWMH